MIDTVLHEIFIKNTTIRKLLMQFLAGLYKNVVLKSLQIHCFCRKSDSVRYTWVSAMSV